MSPIKPTNQTKEKEIFLLEYEATYTNAVTHYKASDMVLNVESNAAYITMPEARTCYSGNFYLRDWP